jgi:hypothetical protein
MHKQRSFAGGALMAQRIQDGHPHQVGLGESLSMASTSFGMKSAADPVDQAD